LREIFDPTVNKIAGIVREQAEGVWQDCKELPKVRTGIRETLKPEDGSI
jgi:hypothetical protein